MPAKRSGVQKVKKAINKTMTEIKKLEKQLKKIDDLEMEHRDHKIRRLTGKMKLLTLEKRPEKKKSATKRKTSDDKIRKRQVKRKATEAKLRAASRRMNSRRAPRTGCSSPSQTRRAKRQLNTLAELMGGVDLTRTEVDDLADVMCDLNTGRSRKRAKR